MPDDDLNLLREFARNNSEKAFAALVARHVNLVYSVALRSVRDPHLAGEITQAVFIILARKAHSLGDKTILPGWLCRTARYASANALTIQRRRQQREQEAYMQSILNETANESALNETWNRIAPLLDGAMEKLGQKDHDALVLRFFENKTFAEVGATLGASEDAAKMRVNRALEKLRKFFTKRGVSSTTVIIAGTISANSVQAAPVTLAKTVTAVAIAKGAAASGSTLTLIKGALKIMAWTKMKTAIVAGIVVLLAAGTTTITVKEIQQRTFYIGQTFFPKGDSIEITSVKRTGEQMVVKGHYNLVSADSALLALYISTRPNEPAHTSPEPNNKIQISKGRGDFKLSHSVYAGLPHVTMYPLTAGKGFAEDYFGTKEEANLERTLRFSDQGN